MITKNQSTSLATTVPGVAFEHSSLIISDDISDEDFNEVVSKIRKAGRAMQWYYGDLGIHAQKKRGEHYTETLAERLGIDRGHLINCVTVSRFFKPPLRNGDLSYNHHLVAMQTARAANAADVESMALDHLAHAKTKGLSVSELRKHGRITLGSPAKYAAGPEINPFTDLDRADRWAMQHRDMAIQPEQAEFLSIRICALMEFVDRVRQIAKQRSAA